MDKEIDLLEETGKLLPRPVRRDEYEGGVRLIGGDPGVVVAEFRGGKILLSQYDAIWEGPHTLTVRPIPLVTVQCDDMTGEERAEVVKSLIRLISKRRRKLYERCQDCNKLTAPEYQHGDDTCQGCAQRELGVDY